MGRNNGRHINSPFAAVAEEEILQMFTFLECVVLSLSLYANTIILFNLSEWWP